MIGPSRSVGWSRPDHYRSDQAGFVVASFMIISLDGSSLLALPDGGYGQRPGLAG
jgi:hypothetical protein